MDNQNVLIFQNFDYSSEQNQTLDVMQALHALNDIEICLGLKHLIYQGEVKMYFQAFHSVYHNSANAQPIVRSWVSIVPHTSVGQKTESVTAYKVAHLKVTHLLHPWEAFAPRRGKIETTNKGPLLASRMGDCSIFGRCKLF